MLCLGIAAELMGPGAPFPAKIDPCPRWFSLQVPRGPSGAHIAAMQLRSWVQRSSSGSSLAWRPWPSRKT